MRRPPRPPGCRPENPLVAFIKARLHRSFFLAFAGAIVLAVTVAAFVVGAMGTGGQSWREQVARAAHFTAHRFAASWPNPHDRDALARDMARDLALHVTLSHPDGRPFVTYTPEGPRPPSPCARPIYRAPVLHPTLGPLGAVTVCPSAPRAGLPAVLGPLGAAVLVLWLLAGKLARRMTRPITALVNVVDAIGQGQLDRRAQLHPHHDGELGALARSVNTMAERIERQVEQQRELLAVVSHEIRSPLARMRFLLESLRDDAARDPAAVDELEREMQGIDALVGDLLASSRMDFGAIRTVPLDPAALAARALERAQLPPDLLSRDGEGTIPADATLLACALDNLLGNARKHGGAVRALRVSVSPEQVTFSVEDPGPGFSSDELPRVFEPFYRGDGARDAQRPGVGLGLSLVRRIAEVHGGTATAENLDAGGARVSITLPRSTARNVTVRHA